MSHNTIHNKWENYNWIAVAAIIAIIFGMLHARALASIGMIVLICNTLIWKQSRLQISTVFKNPYVIFCMLFFTSYLISGIWSEDSKTWIERITIKLPFLLLPIGFASLSLRNLNMLRVLVYGLSITLLINVVQSVAFFLNDASDIVDDYGSSKVLPTSIYNDHIRFSLTLVMLILLNLYFVLERWKELQKWDIVFSIFNILVFAGFIHVLATKTGLLAFYILIGTLGFTKLFKRNKILALCFVIVLPLLAYVSYLKIPTLQAKVNYVIEEIHMIQDPNHQLNYNYSDQGRLISYQMALQVLKSNPLIGVGVGDVKAEMDKAYKEKYPDIPEANRLIPHNQFLYVNIAVGAFLGIIFIIMVILPIFAKGSQLVYNITTAAIFIFAMMVESMLEVQFGVLVYLVFTLLFLHLSLISKENKAISK